MNFTALRFAPWRASLSALHQSHSKVCGCTCANFYRMMSGDKNSRPRVKKDTTLQKWQKQRESEFWRKFDRLFEPKKQKHIPSEERSRTTMMYLISLCLLTVAATYASVPLYRLFCQQTGYGGTTQKGHDKSKVSTMKPNKERVLTVKFNADTAAAMQWNFRPQQKEVQLYAGETALAFYTARNPTATPIDGISTYNVIPFEAGQVSS